MPAEIGWGIEAKLLAQIKALIARNGGSSVAFLQYATITSFPSTGQTGAIYLATDTNKIYYWDGSGYVEMAGSGSSVISYPSLASFPPTGATGVIYIALDTNRLYRWDSGTSAYIEVSPATDAIVVLGAGTNSSLRCGSGNATTGAYSTAFGRSNTSSGDYSSIFGQCNTASGKASTVLAGFKNLSQGSFSTVGGGICNNVCNSTSACLATGATVIGGIGNNTINGTWDLPSCSFLTPATVCNAGAYSTVGGGFQNRAEGGYSAVFAGYQNAATGLVSAVGAGTSNTASGACSFIGGGKTNTSSGNYSAVLGGKFNDTSNFADAMIIGSNLTASQACTTFVNNISIDSLSVGSAVCVTTNKALTTYTAMTGSGTAGQVTYWSGASAVAGSSNFVWDNTNGRLGIGTSSPAVNFHLNTSTAGNIFRLSGANNTSVNFTTDTSGRSFFEVLGNASATSAAGAYFTAQGYQEAWFNVIALGALTNNKYWRFGNVGLGGINNVFAIQKLNDAGNAVTFTSLAVQSGTGNIGINTTTESNYRLDVNGTGASTGALRVTGGNVQFGSATGLNWDNTNERLGIGTNAPAKIFEISRSIGVNDGIRMTNSGGGYFQITNSSSSNFQPIFEAQGVGNVSSMIFKGLQTATGSPTATVMRFVSRASDDSSPVSGVNAMSFENGTTVGFSLSQNNSLLVGTGTDVASSILTMASTTKGFLPPRMTTTQKNAIATPAAGLVVFDTTLAKLCVYTTAWETITSV